LRLEQPTLSFQDLGHYTQEVSGMHIRRSDTIMDGADDVHHGDDPMGDPVQHRAPMLRSPARRTYKSGCPWRGFEPPVGTRVKGSQALDDGVTGFAHDLHNAVELHTHVWKTVGADKVPVRVAAEKVQIE
jgi:hypothetical protein